MSCDGIVETNWVYFKVLFKISLKLLKYGKGLVVKPYLVYTLMGWFCGLCAFW